MSTSDGDVWVFGYGSLIWRPAFASVEMADGHIVGWVRRLWQGSTDHRGVPGRPGRVATIVPQRGGRCDGRAYRLSPAAARATMAAVDVREQQGYCREQVEVTLRDGRVVTAWVYWASEENPSYLGPVSLSELVAQVLTARGPSGTNVDYVLQLDDALRQMHVCDAHISKIATRVRQALAR